MSTKIKQLDVLADWPDIAPQGWHVFNAPRPIYGHLNWRGDFREGVFYAAVDPSDTLAAEYIHENRSLHAVLLRYVTEAEVKAWCTDHLRKLGYEKTADNFTFAECWQSYCASGAGSREVEI